MGFIPEGDEALPDTERPVPMGSLFGVQIEEILHLAEDMVRVRGGWQPCKLYRTELTTQEAEVPPGRAPPRSNFPASKG